MLRAVGVTRRNQRHSLCSQGAHSLMKSLGTAKQAGIIHDLQCLSSFHIAMNKFTPVLPLLGNRTAQHDRNRIWEGNIKREESQCAPLGITNQAPQFRRECILPAWLPGQLQFSLKS